ncbi:hypothetical protein R75461_07681 [Paraburkholderia nemoris]|uniref:hypothetical protein n=1 Tax=Paraburkholderia nemoris TaxID=2793076 RepID=UPI001B29E0C2|nr:hypothetical protein [Paraburkholderia nemoris]CAE6855394.1 hypothetical protein R75461_07681 [Paraburkholderia nemoris]
MNTADDLASLGLSMVVDEAPEIALRCAASRIYYAAYHICKQQADTHCTPLQESDKSGQGLHAQLFKRLSENSKNAKLDELLDTLAQSALKMKTIRIDADYKLEKDFRKKDADRCSSLLEEVKELCGEIAEAAA